MSSPPNPNTMTSDFHRENDVLKDAHLRELMDRAWQGIGRCSFAVNSNRTLHTAVTFLLLGILGVLRAPKVDELAHDYIGAVKSTPALIARMKSARAVSAPLWFANEVDRALEQLFETDTDYDVPAADRLFSSEHWATTQIACCALWSLGFGELDADGVSEFARHMQRGHRLSPIWLN